MANSRWQQTKKNDPAHTYNEKRRIVLATAKDNVAKARHYLEGYKKILGPAGYAGMKAELEFFDRHETQFKLTPALDVGDAVDFTGEIGGEMNRFDVTTNINFKKLNSYEPFQVKGHRYRIAVWDGADFELVDINFPFCPHCKIGRILPTGLLLGENVNVRGESQWSNDQQLVAICGSCGEYELGERLTTPFLYDFNYWYQSLNEAAQSAEEAGEPAIDIQKEIQEHASAVLRHLRGRFGQYLVGVGGRDYCISNPRDGEGHWKYHLVQIAPLARDHLRESYLWEHFDL
jgi:hypothetical protein